MKLHASGGETDTSLCEVADVKFTQTDADVVAADVETPRAGQRTATWALPITGWAVGDSSPADRVAVTHRGEHMWWLPVHDRRPDVAASHPDSSWARYAGFSGAVGCLRLPLDFELGLTAHMRDGAQAEIASISGSRAPLRSGYEPQLQPFIVTTLGRTGSTWLVHLLAAHPSIVAYRPFSFEPRAATYWIDVLTSLSEPASYTQQVDGEVEYPAPWWLGPGARMTSESMPDEPLSRWLGSDNLEQIAAFAQQRLDAVYLNVAALSAERPAFFAEKCLPENNVPQLLRELYPDAAEVFLVRDFRDMVCSIRSFNEKRGREGFGAAAAEGDETYISQVLAPSVTRLLDEWRARRGRAHLVRYEDLIDDPHRALADMLAFAGLDDAPALVDSMVAGADQEIPGMALHRTAASARASIGRWHEELPGEVAQLCEQAFGPALEEFRYIR
jgi:hypothetical protein